MGLPLKLQQINNQLVLDSPRFLFPSYKSEAYLKVLNSQYNHGTSHVHGIDRQKFISSALEEISSDYYPNLLLNRREQGISAKIFLYGNHNENLFLGLMFEKDILPSLLNGHQILMGSLQDVDVRDHKFGINADYHFYSDPKN